MASVVKATSGFLDSLSAVSAKSEEVKNVHAAAGIIHRIENAVRHPLDTWEEAKECAIRPISSRIAKKIAHIGWDSKDVSRTCVKNLAKYSGISGLGEQAFESGLSLLGEGDSLLKGAARMLGWGIAGFVRNRASDKVFEPIVILLREKMVENLLQKGMSLALDTGVLAVTGALSTSHLTQIQECASVAGTVASVASVAAFTYVYGKPVYYGGKLALECCLFKKSVSSIEAALQSLNLGAVTTKSTAIILATCFDSLNMGGLDIADIISDPKLISAIVTIASKTKLF